jgi:transcriptional regulator with XRE-family HTH domain
MNRIGERIKKRRALQNLHLNELADMVGISSSALSQIEKSKSFPSIITLKSIAEHLHTTVGELIGENEALVSNPVVLRNEMKFVDQNKSGTVLYQLSHNDTNKYMDTYLVRFAKASSTETFFQNSQGQVFCHIIEGEIRFKIEEKLFLLKPGDSIYFNARESKYVVNNYDGISEMLWIQSPATF